MTDEEINREVAEACGWSEVEVEVEVPSLVLSRKTKWVKKWKSPDGSGPWASPPSYTHDLDACHEMALHLRKTGDQFQWLNYHQELFRVVWPNAKSEGDYIGGGLAWSVVEATARQRAEAFLRTLGRWKEAI